MLKSRRPVALPVSMFWSSTCEGSPPSVRVRRRSGRGEVWNVPVKAGDDERIAFPDILQTGSESLPLVRSAAFFLLENLAAVPELVELDVEALTELTRAYPISV